MSHVLIVEDDAPVRVFLVRALQQLAPATVFLQAADGAEGLSVFLERSPDLIISDVRMPVMSGIEMLRAVRALAPQLPFIIISADASAEREAWQAGVTAFLHKPLSLERLRRAVAPFIRL